MGKFNNKQLIQCIHNFDKAKVIVIGDIIADHYIWGKVERISPEAPVPIVDVQREGYMLGGAGNVANNILSLSGKVTICGVVGNDAMGQWITHNLKAEGIDTGGIAVEDSRPTSKKTRVVAHSQHVVRFDHESRGDISQESQDKILDYINSHIDGTGIIVISDYAKGVVTSHLVKGVLEIAKQNNLSVIVDPKLKHFNYYTGATVITPNTNEASAASGIKIVDDATLYQAGETLLKHSEADAILITRGENGMSLFEKNGSVTHVPSVARKVFDVTGAGDTVVSTLALSIAAGASLSDASRIANYAAGIVVGIVGTATVKREELLRTVSSEQ